MLTLVGVATIGTIGVAIDPLDVFVSFRSKDYPMAFGTAERTSKAYAVRARKPDALVLGTSRPAWGYSVERAPWASMNAYNLSISAAHIHESRRLLEHAVAFAKPKLILLALDQIMFRAPTTSSVIDGLNDGSLAVSETGDRRPFPWQDLLGIALSVDLLWSNRPSMRQSAAGEFSSSGLLTLNPNPIPLTAQQLPRIFQEKILSTVAYHESSKYGDYGQHYWNSFLELRKILEIARSNTADIRIAINPVHVTLLEALRQRDVLRCQDKWKKDVINTVDSFVEDTGYGIPIWDFNTVNPETTEVISNARLIDVYQEVTFLDAGHFFPTLGNRIQDEIFGLSTRPGSLGVALRLENIEQHLDLQQDLLEEWGRKNPKIVAWISGFLASASDAAQGDAANGECADR